MMTKRTRALRTALVITLAHGVVAEAAPPREQNTTQDRDVEQLVMDAQKKAKKGDHLGAIVDFQEAYEKLEVAHDKLVKSDPSKAKRQRAEDELWEVGSQLADAHWEAYNSGDKNRDHLERVQTLMMGSDVPEVERLKEVAAEINSLLKKAEEAAKAEAEKALVEAEKAEKAEKDAAVVKEGAKQEAEEAKQEAKSTIANAAKRFDDVRGNRKIYFAVGGSLMGLGLVSLSTTTVLLSKGRSYNDTNSEYAEDPTTTLVQYETLFTQGWSANRAAWVTGVIGGALLVSGALLMIAGPVKHKWPEGAERVQLGLGAHGFELRF